MVNRPRFVFSPLRAPSVEKRQKNVNGEKGEKQGNWVLKVGGVGVWRRRHFFSSPFSASPTCFKFSLPRLCSLISTIKETSGERSLTTHPAKSFWRGPHRCKENSSEKKEKHYNTIYTYLYLLTVTTKGGQYWLFYWQNQVQVYTCDSKILIFSR